MIVATLEFKYHINKCSLILVCLLRKRRRKPQLTSQLIPQQIRSLNQQTSRSQRERTSQSLHIASSPVAVLRSTSSIQKGQLELELSPFSGQASSGESATKRSISTALSITCSMLLGSLASFTFEFPIYL